MPTDLAALRNRLQNLNRRTNASGDIWKPKDEHVVRCVKNPHSPDPMQELWFHYELGDVQSVLCPLKNFGKDCIICDFCETLRSWKDENGKDKEETLRKKDFEIFKKLQPKARIYTTVVVRGKESEGAKYWGLSVNQAQQILELCAEGERLTAVGLDPTDTVNALNVVFDAHKAFDISVSIAKPGEKGNTKTFTMVTIKGKLSPTPLAKDAAEIKKILESIKPLKEVFPEVPSDEVKRIFQKYVGNAGAEAAPSTEGGIVKGGESAPKTNSKEDAAKPGKRTLDEAFGDMIGDKK